MIGTTETHLKKIRNGNLKLTNITQEQVEKKKTSIWLQILKFIGIGVLAAGLAAVGQEWATVGLIAWGASDAAITTTSLLVSASIEFGVLEISDAIEGNVNLTNSLTNALPFLGLIRAVPQGLKLNKVLELAASTGLLKDLKYTDQQIKSLSQLSRMLSKQNVVYNHVVYKFGKPSDAKSMLLKLIADSTATKGISIGAKNLKTGLKFENDRIQELLDLQKLLRQVNPDLYPHVSQRWYQETKDIVKQNNFKAKDFLNDEKFGKLLLNARTTKGNKSASIVWVLYGMRQTAQIEHELINRLLTVMKKTSNFLEKVNPLYWMKRETKRAISLVKKSSKKWIKKQIKNHHSLQVIKKNYDRTVDLINRLNHIDLKKIVLKADEELDQVLFPINSSWLLGYKFKKILNEYIVTIYFKNPRYQPRVFHWNQLQFDKWLRAVAENQAGEYYKANLELGYHLKMSSFKAVLKFLPPVMLQFIKQCEKTFEEIKRIKKMSIDYVTRYGDSHLEQYSEYLKYLKQEAINWSASILFTSVIYKNTYKNWINHKDNEKYFQDLFVGYAHGKLIAKIPTTGRIM